MKKKMVIFTEQGVYGDLDVLQHGQMTSPSAAHYKMADAQNQYDVTVLTTCADESHEQAGITDVIHIGHEEPDEKRKEELNDIIRQADVCVFVGCVRTAQPIRSLLISVPSSCKLYNCHFNEGENKFPRLKNLMDAFCASFFAPPAEAFADVLKDLERFPD